MEVPAIETSPHGVVVPTPTRPLSKTLKSGRLLESATTNPAVVPEVSFPVTESLPHGVEVPMPTEPLKMLVPVVLKLPTIVDDELLM